MKRSILSGVPALAALTLLFGFSPRALWAEDLFLAEGSVAPGRLWLSEGFTADRPIHHREPRANPAYPNAVMKLSQAVVDSEGKIYYCSGLDGYLMHLLDGRHEIHIFEVDGQIRDLACSGEPHTVYFSTVATPQNYGPLEDGVIWRRDLYDGRPSVLARVRQADLGGQWWGTFTIQGGHVYLATLHDQSRIYKLTSEGPVRVYEGNRYKITSLAAGPGGTFFFTNGTGKVYRTRDFVDVEAVLNTEHRLTEATMRVGADWPRP